MFVTRFVRQCRPHQCRFYTSAPEQHIIAPLSDALLDHLRSIVSTVSTNHTVLQAHGSDESYHTPMPPQAVIYPTTHDQVVEVVKACTARRTPIVPFGAGTSLEGHIAAIRGGVCIDMSRMNQIIEVADTDMWCRVQAGVTRKQLNEHLQHSGLFFPVDPGADATLGGMTSTRASGTTTVKYGTMQQAVLSVRAVLADGREVRTGRPVRKSSAGYDLTALFVGAEGTLGILTEVDLRLHPIPEAITAAVCEFPTLEQAVDAVTSVLQCGVPVARIELLDAASITAINAYSNTNLTPTPTIFFEFHGSPAAVQEAAQATHELTTDHGAVGYSSATTPEDRATLWAARHTAYWAARALRPGCQGFPTDVCVPVSRLADMIAAAQALVGRYKLQAPMVGHVGDGNFHMLLLVDTSDAEEMAAAAACVDEMVQLAQEMGGTCTGEHGVGYGKLGYLHAERGPVALELMAAIKHAFDPHDIFNPGKLGSRHVVGMT